MEKYLKAEMEVVTFEAEDVIATSGCASDCSADCKTESFDGEGVCPWD